MARVLVYTGVYNEERHVEALLDSLRGQTFTDFEVHVSNNHSTDSTTEILARFAAKDARIKIISPPSFVSNLEHGVFLFKYLKQLDFQAALYLGGHDFIGVDYIERLWDCMVRNPTCVVAYPKRAYEVDDEGHVLKSWGSSPQTVGVPQPFKTIMTLLTLVYNIPCYGLWRYDFYRNGGDLFRCLGSDHFLAAEASAIGDLIEVDGPELFLRRASGSGDLSIYQQKHLGKLVDLADDFVQQLKWFSRILDRICEGQPESITGVVKSSALSMYILRYSANLPTAESREKFFAIPEVATLLSGSAQLGGMMGSYLSRVPGGEVR